MLLEQQMLQKEKLVKYAAYQQLHDNWKQVAVDLEIIQTEGEGAITQVDPNMVIKKKDNKEQEVQEGWLGHIIPFDLAQKHLLTEELAALKAKENELAEIASTYSELLDELSEEDKEKDFVNEAKDAFVPAEVKKALKAKDDEPETLAILKKVDMLITKEKTLKKQIKEDSAALHIRTKFVIEELSVDEAMQMLEYKWIVPLVENINKLPEIIVADFIAKLESLCAKYETTFAEVEKEIAETEQTLIGLLDELEGDEFDMQGLAELKKLLGGE